MSVHAQTGITALNDDEVRALLEASSVAIEGQFVDASNSTLLVRLENTDDALAVYKPVQGTRPLHDFDASTLSRREVQVFELSRLFGLSCIPVTVWREDLPYGPGSLQIFIEHDGTEVADVIAMSQPAPMHAAGDNVGVDILAGYRVAFEGTDEDGDPVALVHRDDPQLRSLALFDAIINNADRKAGHVLRHSGRWYGIDNGLSLHPQDKLRTIFWGWAGEALSDAEREWLGTLADDASMQATIGAVLQDEPVEFTALIDRARTMLRAAALPKPDPRRRSIPWPVF